MCGWVGVYVRERECVCVYVMSLCLSVCLSVCEIVGDWGWKIFD